MKLVYKTSLKTDLITFSLFKEDLKTDYVINNDSKELKQSLKNVLDEFNAYLETHSVKKYSISISTGIIKSNDLDNILWSILKSFNSWDFNKEVEVFITHKGSKNKEVENIINVATKIHHARTLAMLPANMGYPEAMKKHFQMVFKNVATKIKVFSRDQLKKKGFNLILSVGDSASVKHKPLLMTIERLVKNPRKTICFVGKGITFDSGGLNIKTGRNSDIEKMKYDKIGAIYAAYAMLDLIQKPEFDKINFVAILPFAENAVSDKSTRPGDVIKSHSGKTVEIVDTDAEGRLILADALSYACSEYKPDLVIDIATLTGFAEEMSCAHCGYYYTENDFIKKNVEEISFKLGERMIPMMTWNDMGNILKSNVADILNVSRKDCNDSFVAAIFLKEFITCIKTDWLHIDLSHEFDNNIPEGNGIRTMIHIVKKYLGIIVKNL